MSNLREIFARPLQLPLVSGRPAKQRAQTLRGIEFEDAAFSLPSDIKSAKVP